LIQGKLFVQINACLYQYFDEKHSLPPESFKVRVISSFFQTFTMAKMSFELKEFWEPDEDKLE
jgi:hypothetical protein